MVLTWGGEGAALPLPGCCGDPSPMGDPMWDPMDPTGDPVSCLTMPVPSCWSKPEPCDPPRHADGLRDLRLLMDELRKGVLELVLGMLPPIMLRASVGGDRFVVEPRRSCGPMDECLLMGRPPGDPPGEEAHE